MVNLSDTPSDMATTVRSLSDRQHQLCPDTCVHGKCLLLPNNTAYCSCHVHYTGANCTEIRTVSRGKRICLFLSDNFEKFSDEFLATISFGNCYRCFYMMNKLLRIFNINLFVKKLL